jgi:hypothetical protein
MVFKGRFFSSSRKSSPDGSNSPKTPTQGSPSTRSDKKKVKSDPSPSSTPSPSSSSSRKYKDKEKQKEKEKEKDKEKERDQKPGYAGPKDGNSPYLSPILASSLGLNKIKTRSGPLPQEGLRGDHHRISGLGSSNLSRGRTDTGSLNAGSFSSASSSSKKEVRGSVVKVAEKKLGLDAELPLPAKSGNVLCRQRKNVLLSSQIHSVCL